MPSFDKLDKCKSWKPQVHQLIKGGFNPDYHPIKITTATVNAKNNYDEVGYLPVAGSTQVWRLAEQLISMIAKDLELIRDRFPVPRVDE
jgi:hypothetical protein